MPIIQSISRFLNNLQTPFTIMNAVNRQRAFIKKNIEPLIAEAQRSADGSLDENDIKKITGYYGLAVPAVLGEAFCALRGDPMTPKERAASTGQGAMTGLGDDFFDKQRLSEQGVKDLIERPGDFQGTTASEKLFLHFYKTALSNAPKPAEMQQQIFRVFHAQLLSKQQDQPGLAADIMKDITIRKGAESLLYYRTAFDHPLKNGEEKMLFVLGGLMQLSNDIFDVYKDREAGVNTLVTTAASIKELRTYYGAVLRLGKQAAFRSGYPKENVRKFIALLSIGIFSRCFVCLDQLQKNEKRTAGRFDVRSYSRKELICDMDTAGNKLRSLRYHLKICK
jgi:hypothetical protein